MEWNGYPKDVPFGENKMRQIKVSIKGVAPLLQHKMSIEQEAQLASKTKKSTGQSKGDDPESYLYIHKGVICQPAEHILQAIIKRLGGYKIQGKGKKTYLEMGKGSIIVEPDMIPHLHQEYELDTRTVVIKATKGRVVRVRPMLSDWELDFTISLINDEMPVEVVKAALDDAGREGGIGDFRPRFGRFIVTEFKQIS